jgi:hypothetical protein
MLLEYLPDLERFDVIVFLTGANDFLLRIAQDDTYDPHELATESGRLHSLRRAFEILPPRMIGKFPQNTELWQRLEPPIRQLVRPVRHGDAAGKIYLTWRRHRREATSFRSALPDLSAAIDEYRRNLIRLVELTRKAGAEPVLLTQPHLWRPGLPPELDALLWMGGIGAYWDHPGSSYYTPAALASGMQRYNAVVREVGRQLDVAVVDVAASLPRTRRSSTTTSTSTSVASGRPARPSQRRCSSAGYSNESNRPRWASTAFSTWRPGPRSQSPARARS